MPLYDYRCSACAVVREHRQKISDEPIRECPDCGGEYKRIITSVGIIFKGSGFHINDYRDSQGGNSSDSSSQKDESAPKKEAPAEVAASETKTEKSGDGGSSSSETGKQVA